ncbi:hypothetical protein M9458_053504, partial [Cirrhinus mrigala]
MGVGSFDSGQSTANHESPSPLPSHALATTIEDPSNPIHTGISSNLNAIETLG